MHNLKPVSILGITISALKIGTITVELDQTATIPVTLHTNADEVSASFSSVVQLTGDEYSAWGNDDNFVIDAVCKRLGLARA